MEQTIPIRAEFEDLRRKRSTASRVYSFLRRWPVLPAVILLVLVFTAIFAPVLAPYDPIKDSLRDSLAPPAFLEGGTANHILGTDDVGRDILSRMIYGARISLMLSAVAVITGLAGGVTLGVVSGYFGGWLEEIILRVVDVWLAMPFILFALVVVSIFGKSLGIMFALLAALAWSAFVRNIRAEVLVLREMDYVQMSRVMGASSLRIMLRHILPGVVNTAIVISTLRVGQLMLAEASLSFLGAGIPEPIPAWGVMVASGRDFLGNAWWVSFFPGFAIFLVVMALNFMGDWLRDFFDPRLRQLAR
jgi:peptide/nickel transport system permease protein